MNYDNYGFNFSFDDEEPHTATNSAQSALDAEFAEEEALKVDSTEERGLNDSSVTGKANILVVGIGGGGNNAVNNMILQGITSARFVAMNTDMQALNAARVAPGCKIQLGAKITGGLGAGSIPETGRKAAEESRDIIEKALKGVDLLFITAGMGGGTGTGAAPIVAEIAKNMGILTVAVVTKPFKFEGAQRLKNAEEGINNLRKFVDTIVIIPNQKLVEVFKNSISVKNAFAIADKVLFDGIKSISELITKTSLINLDFADVKTVLKNKGLAHMGVGTGKGEKAMHDAIKAAVSNPLLETDITGASAIIVHYSGGENLDLLQIDEATNLIAEVLSKDARIIFGADSVDGKNDITITLIATGFESNVAFNRSAAPADIPTAPMPQAIQFEDAAADFEPAFPSVKPNAGYNPDIFATRPVFGQKTVSAQQSSSDFEKDQRQNMQAQTTQIQKVSQQEASVDTEAETEVKSSRIDVTSKQVPAFLRYLKKNRD